MGLAAAAVVVWADRRFRLGHGRAFALYVVLYCAGRLWIEMLRDDTAEHFLGLRLNVFTAIVVGLGAVVFFVALRGGRGRSSPRARAPPDVLDGDRRAARTRRSARRPGSRRRLRPPTTASRPAGRDRRARRAPSRGAGNVAPLCTLSLTRPAILAGRLRRTGPATPRGRRPALTGRRARPHGRGRCVPPDGDHPHVPPPTAAGHRPAAPTTRPGPLRSPHGARDRRRRE